MTSVASSWAQGSADFAKVYMVPYMEPASPQSGIGKAPFFLFWMRPCTLGSVKNVFDSIVVPSVARRDRVVGRGMCASTVQAGKRGRPHGIGTGGLTPTESCVMAKPLEAARITVAQQMHKNLGEWRAGSCTYKSSNHGMARLPSKALCLCCELAVLEDYGRF